MPPIRGAPDVLVVLAGQVASRLGFGTPSVASLVDVVQASELFDDSYTPRPENEALV